MNRRFAPVLALLGLASALACSPAAQQPAKPTAPAAKPAVAASGDAERVMFTTADQAGVTIIGDLYLPEKTPAPAVLALHQWGADRSTYRAFGKAMREAGFVVLAIDARGFGESTVGADGKVGESWNSQDDIAAAVDYLKSQPGVDAQRIGIIGASYGASNALIFAADNPVDIRSAALLSVGLNYHGSLPTEPALRKYGDRPLLMVAAQDDVEDGPQTTALAALVKNPRYRVQMYDKGGHGTSLLAPDVGGLDAVKAFFVKTLTGPIADRPTADDKAGEPTEPPSTGGTSNP